MRPLVIIAIVLCYLFASFVSYGHSETFFKYGAGFSAPDQTHIGQVSLLSVGQQKDFFYNVFDYKVELGGWYDDTKHRGARNSFFGSGSVGVDVDARNVYANWFFGGGLITTPDSSLGGYFQLFHDAEIGLQSYSKKRIGVFFKHISDAGIRKPNKGRNFLGLKASLPF